MKWLFLRAFVEILLWLIPNDGKRWHDKNHKNYTHPFCHYCSPLPRR